MLASFLTFTGQEHRYERVAQHMRARSAFHWVSLMTDFTPTVEAFILIKVDLPEQSLACIRDTLEPLGIPVSIGETSRQLHWSTVVLVGVPEQRLADAMLALELKGFSDVMAFHGEANTDATQSGGAPQQ